MQPLSPEERERLAQFVLGREMPYPQNVPDGVQSAGGDTLPVPFEDLERLRAWIAQGAIVTKCTTCTQ
jgi:hypothetical protein